MIQSSKLGETNYYNYDDICYSSGNFFHSGFEMVHIHEWDVIICASNNAIEVRQKGKVTCAKRLVYPYRDIHSV